MQTLSPLFVLILSSVERTETDLFAELPVDEDTAFRRLADEHKRLCYRHITCQPMSDGKVTFPTTEKNRTSASMNFSSSAECVSDSCNCCGYCTCDAECINYGTCCLGVYRDFDHALQSTNTIRYGCVLPQYLTNEQSDFKSEGKHYWMITRCGPDYPNDKNRNLCENPGLDGSPESLVPVTDPRSHVHYRNIYCYHCNRVGIEASLIYWTLDIQNHHYISIPNGNLLEELKQQRGNIFFSPPSYVAVKECNALTLQISRCNETGLWKMYNKFLETACKSFLDPFNYTYKNYFCYLCNVPDILPEGTWECPFQDRVGGITNINPPFFAILDISAIKDELAHEKLHCDPDQIKDEVMMRCRDVLCHKDRKLINGACTHKQERGTNDTCFSAFMRLNPFSNQTYIEGKDPFIRRNIREILTEKLLVCNEIENEFMVFNHADDLDNIDYFVIMIVVFMPANKSDCYNYIETLNAMLSGIITVRDHADTAIDFGVENAIYNTSLSGKLITLFVPDILESTVKILGTDSDRLIRNPCGQKKLTEINKLFLCPFIMLGLDEMSMTVENDFLYLADINSPNKTLKIFSKWEYEIHDGQIFVCLEDFADLYNVMLESKSSKINQLVIQEPENLKDIVSLACTSLSIACLSVTILTYLTHPSLQSQPGINNVILCIFLLLSQTMYQFGAGQTSLPDFVCSLIGAMCHFLWLSVMFSMTICCIQMFTIFKAQAKISSKFDTWQIARHVLYVTCFSSLFVFINIVVSLVRSGGVSIGYGGIICYLSSNLMQLITFVAPAAMSLVINATLFAYVVYKIKKVSSANILDKERNYLSVYARLSTLTGLTWAFGFFRLLFETDIFEYLFIIFNAGQGVFIMAAFVLNKRVLSLIFKKDKTAPSEYPTDIQATRRETIN